MPPPRVSFFTGGRRLEHGGSYIVTDQNYVQYIRPHSASSNSTPLLFVHGGGCTGSQWECTPDRRPGWAILACNSGLHVYLTNGADSGRSMRVPDRVRRGGIEHRSASEMWTTFRFGHAGDFQARKSFLGCLFDIDHLDALVASQAPRRRNTDDIETTGIINVIKELAVDGPIDTVVHSHGGTVLVQALKAVGVRPMVRTAVLVEPATTDTSCVADSRVVTVWSDFIEQESRWRGIKNAWVNAEWDDLVLPDSGVKGNSHFPMSDKNSDEVF